MKDHYFFACCNFCIILKESFIIFYKYWLGKPQKKVLLLMAGPLRPYPLPPKSLMARPLHPSLLMSRPLREEFLRLPLVNIIIVIFIFSDTNQLLTIREYRLWDVYYMSVRPPIHVHYMSVRPPSHVEDSFPLSILSALGPFLLVV